MPWVLGKQAAACAQVFGLPERMGRKPCYAEGSPVSRLEVVPAELTAAGSSLRGMGREAAFVGQGGHGSVGCGELSGALEGFCGRAHGTAAQLHQAGFAVAGAYATGATGYEATDQSAMPERG